MAISVPKQHADERVGVPQTLVMLIIIPLPLFFAQTVYGVGGLTAWVVIGMIWAFCSAIAVVLYPLYESREALQLIGRGMIKVREVCATEWGS